jgi:hypothetical protein
VKSCKKNQEQHKGDSACLMAVRWNFIKILNFFFNYRTKNSTPCYATYCSAESIFIVESNWISPLFRSYIQNRFSPGNRETRGSV